MKLRPQAARAAVACLAFFCVQSAAAAATLAKQPIAYDYGAWLPVSVKVPLWRKWQGFVEFQPRFQRNHQQSLTESILRTGIGYQLTRQWTVFGGYYWSAHNDAIMNYENRIWEQIGYTRKFEKITLQSRFRCEQTWRDNYDGPAWRIRNQVRVTREIGGGPYYLCASEEPFWNLNSPAGGPLAGFAQNRAFVGVGKKVNSFTRVEVGYLNQYKTSRSLQPDTMNHVLVASVALDFTGFRAKKKPETKMADGGNGNGNGIQIAAAPQIVMRDFYSPTVLVDVQESGVAHPLYHPALAGLSTAHGMHM